MSFGDSTFHQHNLFLRSMPRIGAVNQAALSAIQPHVELFGRRMLYTFKAADAATRGSDALTDALLEANERSGAGMKLLKTTGQYPTGFLTYSTGTVYRFQSDKNGGYIDFDFFGKDSGMCHILIVFVFPSRQGNFYNAQDLIINRFAKTLFDLKDFNVSTLFGEAMANQWPVRQRRDWREKLTKHGTTKLVRFYELLNFQRVEPDSNFLCLHRSKMHQKRLKPIPQPQPVKVTPVCADYVI